MKLVRANSSSVSLVASRSPKESSQHISSIKEALFVCGCVLGGALLRYDFMRAGGFVIDSDEAIVGLMAKHIGEGGPIPTFYYGQHYMGSLEALCAVVTFALFGISSFSLQLVPLLFSLLLIVTMYWLGRLVGGAYVGRIAALLSSFPPAALVVWSFKARGGFIEVVTLGALSLCFALLAVKRRKFSVVAASVAVFLIGIGWWVNNQILYFMAPVGLILGGGVCRRLLAKQIGMLTCVGTAGLLVATFFLGSAPYWIYNVREGFPSLGMFTWATREALSQHVAGLWTTAVPILLGGKKFWEANPSVSGLAWLAYGLYGALFGAAVWSKLSSTKDSDVATKEPVWIFLVFILFTCAIFCASSFGWLVQAPRYLLPLYVGLFILCGVGLKHLARASSRIAMLTLATLLGLNVASCYWGGRAIPGEPVVFKSDRVSRDHSQLMQTLDELGIRHVRTNYWIGYRLAFETQERVTFRVLQEPRQVRIRSYQVLPSGGSEDEIPLLLVPSERGLFVRALDLLGYRYDEREANRYSIIFNIRQPTRQPVSSIPLTSVQELKASGPLSASLAMDGSVTTRWGTGSHQQPGQTYEINLRSPVELTALSYDLGTWTEDYPRALQIDIIDDQGVLHTLLSPADHDSILAFQKGSPFMYNFAPRVVQGMRLTQRGTHPILDWSMAELHLFTPVRGALTDSSRGGSDSK